jgi:hypothetical protein
MPMRSQPDGVRRVPRDGTRPPREYAIFVDGEPAGHVERLAEGGWRGYRDGEWPRKFPGRGAYLAAVEWMAEAHRAARKTTEPVTVAEASAVRVLDPAVADPFRGDPFADPLA